VGVAPPPQATRTIAMMTSKLIMAQIFFDIVFLLFSPN
jgi:hypothetical protein